MADCAFHSFIHIGILPKKVSGVRGCVLFSFIATCAFTARHSLESMDQSACRLIVLLVQRTRCEVLSPVMMTMENSTQTPTS